MNPARAVRTNDTTPPPETSLRFARDAQYVGDLVLAKTVEAPDWTKPDAYLQGSYACATTLSADSGHYLLPSALGQLPRLDLRSLRGRTTLVDICISNDTMKFFILVKETKKTTESQLLSFVYEDVQAHIKNADFLYFSGHGLPAQPDLLEGYEQYQVANWDQFDAEPITAETLNYARRLMRVMPTSLGAPDVAPAADGSITLEWVPDDMTHKLDKLFLDIGPGEEWRAYWKLRNGKFDRLRGDGFPADTMRTLKNLFNDLSA